MMNMKSGLCIIAVMLCHATSFAQSEDSSDLDEDPSESVAEIRKEDKTQLGFDDWPGKEGKLKAGFLFDPTTPPQLAGFTVDDDDVLLWFSTTYTASIRNITLTNGTETVTIQIRVTQESTDETHEALFTRLTHFVQGANVYLAGDTFGFALGDKNFINNGFIGATVVLSEVRVVGFVRNNVLVWMDKSDGSTADLVALALSMDNSIDSQADFTAAELKNMIPKITTFKPQSKEIFTNSSTLLDLDVTNPSGLDMEFQFSHDIGINIARELLPAPPKTTFFSSDEPGTATLFVAVFSEDQLFAAAKTEVEVTRDDGSDNGDSDDDSDTGDTGDSGDSDDDSDNGDSDDDESSSLCGATGMEAMVLLGLLMLRRRR